MQYTILHSAFIYDNLCSFSLCSEANESTRLIGCGPLLDGGPVLATIGLLNVALYFDWASARTPHIHVHVSTGD
jgi:hypothetical protein